MAEKADISQWRNEPKAAVMRAPQVWREQLNPIAHCLVILPRIQSLGLNNWRVHYATRFPPLVSELTAEWSNNRLKQPPLTAPQFLGFFRLFIWSSGPGLGRRENKGHVSQLMHFFRGWEREVVWRVEGGLDLLEIKICGTGGRCFDQMEHVGWV